MQFIVRLNACVLVRNRMLHIESRMRYATNSVDGSHDASVCSSRLPGINLWDGINLLGYTIRQWFTNVA